MSFIFLMSILDSITTYHAATIFSNFNELNPVGKWGFATFGLFTSLFILKPLITVIIIGIVLWLLKLKPQHEYTVKATCKVSCVFLALVVINNILVIFTPYSPTIFIDNYLS